MNGQALMGKSIKVSTAYQQSKEEAQAENEESETQLLLRQKLYAQFYSSINDPQVKAEYERQVLKTFGAEDVKKPPLKQSLEEVRTLSYEETLESQKLLEIIPKVVNSKWKANIEENIYQ